MERPDRATSAAMTVSPQADAAAELQRARWGSRTREEGLRRVMAQRRQPDANEPAARVFG